MKNGMQHLYLQDFQHLLAVSILPLHIDEVRDFSMVFIRELATPIMFQPGFFDLSEISVREHTGNKCYGFITQSSSINNWSIVFSSYTAPLRGLFINKLPWRKRDGTWCIELNFPVLDVESDNYWAAINYEKCYADATTGRVMTDKRHVHVMREDLGKLKFFQVGNPLPFENLQIYKKRKLTDRMSRQYLVECAERIGIDLMLELRLAKPETSYSFAEMHPLVLSSKND